MIDTSWNELKKMIDAGLDFKVVLDTANNYQIFVSDLSIVFKCTIPITDPENPDQVDFDVNYKSRARDILANITPTGKIPEVALRDSEGDFSSIVSHDYTDSSTWPAVDNSNFVVAPSPGNVMYLKKAEVQFTHDIQLAGLTELYFDVWGYNPADLPNKVLYERVVYDSIKAVLNIGNAHYTMPAVDGLANPVTTVQFNYPRSLALRSSQGLEIRVSVKDNVAMTGEFATITFLTSQQEER